MKYLVIRLRLKKINIFSLRHEHTIKITCSDYTAYLSHLWHQLGFEKQLSMHLGLRCDKSAFKTDEVEYVVQVNGKLRGQFTISAEATEEELIQRAKQEVQEHIGPQTVKKSIVVTHRQLINLVVG